MKRIRRLAAVAAALMITTTMTAWNAGPAHAEPLPANYVIKIVNNGNGAVPTWTFDQLLWDCRTEIEGQFLAPTAVRVVCKLRDPQFLSFSCPRMVLLTATTGNFARAGGRASCEYQMDTGIVRGYDWRLLDNDLGQAFTVTCTAYGGNLPLVPPYSVTCGDPDAPALTGTLPGNSRH